MAFTAEESDLPGIPPLVALTLVIALTLAVAVADVFSPERFAVAIFYCVPIALSAWTRDRRVLWGVVGASLALCGLAVGWRGAAAGSSPADVWGNRALVAVALVVLAMFVHLWIGGREALVRSRAALDERREALEAGNQELSDREEEIARQNEELQSQSEEIERQSEELRVTNDELANRERMLAQLLSLSRALATELTSDEVMSAICESLTDLTGAGDAAALLLRHGDDLLAHCHAGFGPPGPHWTQIPYPTSFAALVIARGQAGFIEDVDLRPDVAILQPKQGASFRSVIGAPIVSRGRPIGVLEAYAREPTRWSEEQLNLITSIAAQASVSLETARLFEELGREKQRFEIVFRTLPVAVLVAEDRECTNVSGNPAAAALFTVPLDANYSPFAAVGDRIRRTLFKASRPIAAEDLALVRAVRLGEELHGEEIEVVFASGRRLTVLVSAAPFYSSDGSVSGGVAVFADISAQKALERELETRRRESEEASLRKTRFLAAVSHDIRTPANAIRLQAELIKRSATTPSLAPKVADLAQQLQENAMALVELVGEVLDLTRFDSGKIELQETELSIGEAIADECRQLAAVAQSKGLRLDFEAVEPPLWIRTDRVKLGRVLGNLIENAVKFTAAGEVQVSVRTRGSGAVEIRVRDTGPGIPEEHQARIFDEFFQLRNPERDRAKGRGLGLAICKRLVDAMGAEISLESRSGRGTTFVVSFPPSSVLARPLGVRREPDEPRQDPPARRSLAGIRILIVEDHAHTRSAVAELLLAEGALVTQAADGKGALEALRQSRPQVLLLDLMLPDLDGRQVLESLVSVRPESLRAVIVLTGDSADRSADELRRLGADAIMAKPFEPSMLVEKIRALVG